MTTLPSVLPMPAEFAVSVPLLNSGNGPASPRRSLLRVSAGFAVLSAAAYSLSLAKAVVVARYFGTTSRMDAFAIAITRCSITLQALIDGASKAEILGIRYQFNMKTRGQ